ncbi:hypothetical protein [Thaumasiovibrio sp. DFM-14]|uniref:hypothetical protein n=1 Tax=Thaumasiovibrio sp. DFM-14 TaxID=3384792 RepID=UPI0039A3C699
MENLKPAIDAAISGLVSPFSTHQLIIAVAKANQHAYIEALHAELNNKRPFQSLHANIGRYLVTLPQLTKSEERCNDVDIWGDNSDNSLWLVK